MVQICIFEDNRWADLAPLSSTRPVYTLRLGIKDLLTKILDYTSAPAEKVILHCRKDLTEITAEKNKYRVNSLESEDTIFINGRILADEKFDKALNINSHTEKLVSYNEVPLIIKVAGKKLKHFKFPEVFTKKIFQQFKLKETEAEVTTLNYFWDFLQINSQVLNFDAGRTALLGKHNSDASLVKMVNPHNVFIGNNCILKPGVVLDASAGAIFIDNQAELQPNAVITGPAYIGFKSIIKAGAKIYGGTSIGPNCKIGGEVEGTIIQGYTNKQHEGFLGHSFLGEWINLGAGTENSDLKNNYQPIELQFSKEHIIKSHLLFVGCCIGDHTKTGIKTMLNTGSVFGTFCNLFGAGYQPKYLPDFTWNNVDADECVEHQFDKALATAKIVMQRREVSLNGKLNKLYDKIYRESAGARREMKIR